MDDDDDGDGLSILPKTSNLVFQFEVGFPFFFSQLRLICHLCVYRRTMLCYRRRLKSLNVAREVGRC